LAKDKNVRLECHVRFNRRNPRHVEAATALASVDKQYKSSFIALAIEHYMETHPMGISQVELLDMYRQSERTYQPKSPIAANLTKAVKRTVSSAPPATAKPADDAETSSAIDKAMEFYNV
jgi:hypothetical protein